MSFELAVKLLKEFYYEKNGRTLTIEFLKFIVEELEKDEVLEV